MPSPIRSLSPTWARWWAGRPSFRPWSEASAKSGGPSSEGFILGFTEIFVASSFSVDLPGPHRLRGSVVDPDFPPHGDLRRRPEDQGHRSGNAGDRGKSDAGRQGGGVRKYSLTLLASLVFLLFVGLSWTGSLSSYAQLVIMFMGVNIIMSASLNLVNGYMGEFSCGHAGFMAMGAYTSSLLTVWFFTKGSVFGANLLSPEWAVWLFPFILLFGGVVAALVGLHGGHPLLSHPGRLPGHHHPGRQLHRQERHRKHPGHRRGSRFHGNEPGGERDEESWPTFPG